MSEEGAELEKALRQAYADEASREAFYRLFLETRVYFLTSRPVPPTPSGVTEADLDVPIVKISGPDGPVIPIFSSTARADAFTEGKGHLFGIAGSTAVRTLAATNIPVVLNPNTDVGKLFPPEELRALLEMLGGEVKLGAGTEFQIGQPAEEPKAVMDALRAVFAGYPNVASASLALIAVPGSGEPPHLLIGVRGDALTEAFTSAGLAARKAGADLVDFCPLDGKPNQLTDYFKTVEPFYTR